MIVVLILYSMFVGAVIGICVVCELDIRKSRRRRGMRRPF